MKIFKDNKHQGRRSYDPTIIIRTSSTVLKIFDNEYVGTLFPFASLPGQIEILALQLASLRPDRDLGAATRQFKARSRSWSCNSPV
jgi:hypothetical protein